MSGGASFVGIGTIRKPGTGSNFAAFTSYVVYEERPNDSALLIPAIESHQKQRGCVPRLVAGGKGVKRVCIPNRNT